MSVRGGTGLIKGDHHLGDIGGYFDAGDSLSGRPKRCRLMVVAERRQRLGPHKFEALHRVVAVDLLHIELAHEVDRLLGDDLSGNHNGEAWWIGDDETRRYQIAPVFQAAVDLRIVEAEIFTTRRVVSCKEAGADVTLVGSLSGIAAEAVMEMREIWQIRHVRHHAFHPRIEYGTGIGTALGKITLDLTCDLGQYPDQMRDVAAGIVDVGLYQHRIP